MSLMIDLPQPVEAQIEKEAQKAGISPAELIAQVVSKNFPAIIDTDEQKRLNAPSIALLESWLAEAAKPRTVESLVEAETSMEDLMRNLNTTRREAGERLHFLDVEDQR